MSMRELNEKLSVRISLRELKVFFKEHFAKPLMRNLVKRIERSATGSRITATPSLNLVKRIESPFFNKSSYFIEQNLVKRIESTLRRPRERRSHTLNLVKRIERKC